MVKVSIYIVNHNYGDFLNQCIKSVLSQTYKNYEVIILDCGSDDKSKKIGIKKLSVETGAGEFFAPARRLFDKCGFKPCPPFAHYKKDVNSLYLSKLLYNN